MFFMGVAAGVGFGLVLCFLIMFVSVRKAHAGKCLVCDRLPALDDSQEEILRRLVGRVIQAAPGQKNWYMLCADDDAAMAVRRWLKGQSLKQWDSSKWQSSKA